MPEYTLQQATETLREVDAFIVLLRAERDALYLLLTRVLVLAEGGPGAWTSEAREEMHAIVDHHIGQMRLLTAATGHGKH